MELDINNLINTLIGGTEEERYADIEWYDSENNKTIFFSVYLSITEYEQESLDFDDLILKFDNGKVVICSMMEYIYDSKGVLDYTEPLDLGFKISTIRDFYLKGLKGIHYNYLTKRDNI